MRILLFNEYTSIYGGTDLVVDTESEYLSKQGIDIRLFSFKNLNFNNSSLPKKVSLYWSTFLPHLFPAKLQNAIDSFKPDIIHFHNIYPMFRYPIWAYINPGRAKVVAHMHNFYPFCLNSLMLRKENFCKACFKTNRWYPGIINKCFHESILKSFLVSVNRRKPLDWINSSGILSKILVVSRFLFDQFSLLGVSPESMEIIPNFTLSQCIQKGGNYILFLGNISKSKGIITFCEVAKRIPDILFVAAGDGLELPKLRADYKSVNNLLFTGPVKSIRKNKLLSNCRFLYFPTRCNESFGIVILEAFGYGKPVLTTGLGATSELVRDGMTGLINSSNDIDSQVNSVKRMWEQAQCCSYIRNCYKTARDHSIEKHITHLLRIYTHIL